MISFLSERIPDSEKPFQIAQSLKDETAAALKEKYSQEEIREAFEDIQELIDQEELFTADIYKNFVMDSRSARRLSRHSACISRMTATLPVSTALQKRASIMAQSADDI